MTKPSATQARRLRHMPGYQIVQRYKRAGWTQWRIAQEADVKQSTVSKTIHRQQTGPVAERVWTVLERILK